VTYSGLAAFLGLAALAVAAGPADPFAAPARARVFVFARTGCAITNRYAPELRRIAARFAPLDVAFWIVYPESSESIGAIEQHMREYRFPGKWLHDADHVLTARAQATVAPQAAVFDSSGRLAYTGRIDDRYIDVGTSRPAPTVHDLEDAISSVLAGKPVARPKTRAIGCFLADLK
jgi:hypothetical protein